MPLTIGERAQIDAALNLLMAETGAPPPVIPTPTPPAPTPPTPPLPPGPPASGSKIDRHVANVKALFSEGGGNGRRGEWLALKYTDYMPANYRQEGLEPALVERVFSGNWNAYQHWLDATSFLTGDNSPIRVEDEFPRLLGMIRGVEAGG